MKHIIKLNFQIGKDYSYFFSRSSSRYFTGVVVGKSQKHPTEGWLRIINSTASIIRKDRNPVVVNTRFYSSLDKIFKNLNCSTPESLWLLIDEVISKKLKIWRESEAQLNIVKSCRYVFVIYLNKSRSRCLSVVVKYQISAVCHPLTVIESLHQNLSMI